MDDVIKKIISYLNIGVSPTLVSFPDDGLMHIFDILNRTHFSPQNYDPTYVFVYLSTQSLSDSSIDSLESAIDHELRNKCDHEKDIVDTLKEGLDIAVVIDDIEIHEEPHKQVYSIDGIIKKYKNKIKFIYLIEDPNINAKLQSTFPPSSSIFDAIIYFKIGSWTPESIIKFSINKDPATISKSSIEQITRQSQNHFGIFKRFLRDEIMSGSHVDDYIQYTLDNFSCDEINSFKKLQNGMKLNFKEQEIINLYEKVGFISNRNISIPVIREKLFSYRTKQVVSDEVNKLNLNYDLFTKSEKSILEYMQKHDEVSKDEIAKIIWGWQADEKYSEWAIEQRVSRLRKKFNQYGYKVDIETLYNKGYKLIY